MNRSFISEVYSCDSLAEELNKFLTDQIITKLDVECSYLSSKSRFKSLLKYIGFATTSKN
jgi:hypothetical protein